MSRTSLLGLHSRGGRLSSFSSLCKAGGLPRQGGTRPDDEMPPEECANRETMSRISDDSEKSHSSFSKVPTRKFAILMAYCGRGYHGMQINHGRPDLPTIESTLISALVQAQCVPEIYSTERKWLQFQRCARTDKGVSALGQLVSVRLQTPCTNLVEKINSYLPPEVRILGVKRVTRGFNSKTLCNGRSYSYMVPTFALSRCAPSTPDSSFRLPQEDFHHLNRLLSFYEGTHNFHNFTSQKAAEDPSAWRHMLHVSCCQPFVRHGIEFASILVTGQSFMLYQIRKMVGLIIAVARGIVPGSFLSQCVQMDKVNIPPAPGLGLVLDRVHFESYNRRYGGDGLHQTLAWEETLPSTMAFWEEKIMPVILEGELEDLSMCYWLDKLGRHCF
ncbi:hypothetical protein FKM82_004790 [Ascaphus truei]